MASPKDRSVPPRSPSATSKSTHGPTFGVAVVERMFEGSPRWSERDKAKPLVEKHPPIDREPLVQRVILEVHDRPQSYRGVELIRTCLNKDCADRAYEYYSHAGKWGPGSADAFEKDMYEQSNRALDDLGLSAKADTAGIEKKGGKCAACGKLFPAFAIRPFVDRWIYILSEDGPKKLKPRFEIYAEDRAKWTYIDFRSGDESKTVFDRFTEARRSEAPGSLELPKAAKETWHFFAAPVPLGPKALKMLMESPEHAETAASRFASEVKGREKDVVYEDWTRQPWAPTVALKFSESQVLRGDTVIVPVIDSFYWAFKLNEMDYTPAFVAEQHFLRNEHEQAKLFVAGVYASVTGAKIDEKTKEVSKDEQDVLDDLVEPPGKWKSSESVAHAWLERYEETRKYLATACNDACARLVNFVKFSVGHRITEVSCQEHDEPGFLGHGLLHWHALLRDLHGCSRGQAYIAELVEKGKDHIPVKNVINGEKLGAGSKVYEYLQGKQVPLEIAGLVSPAVIKSSSKPAADAMREVLKGLGAPAAPGLSELKTIAYTGFEIGDKAAETYLKRIDADVAKGTTLDRFDKAWSARARTGRDFFKLFTEYKKFEDAINLFIGLASFNAEAKPHESGTEAYTRIKGSAEYPLKVADFLMKRTMDVMKREARGDLVSLMKKWDGVDLKLGDTAADVLRKAGLSEAEAKIAGASRTMKLYDAFGRASKIISGPVSLVIGGCDFIVEANSTITSWKNGDPGSAWGHALLGGAAACTIIVAGAETAALLSGAAAAGWVPVVGWIGVAITLGATVVIWAFSKSPIELHAMHSFLGGEYGDGSWGGGPAYIGGIGWPRLRFEADAITRVGGYERILKSDPAKYEDKQRFVTQQSTLLNMLTGFEIRRFVSYTTGGRGQFWIFFSFFPPTGVLDIELDMYMLTDKDGPRTGVTHTVKARIWLGDGEVIYTTATRPITSRPMTRHAQPSGGVALEFDWNRVTGMAEGSFADWQVRARLDHSGQKTYFNPISGAWVILEGGKTWMVGVHKISSADTE